MNTSQVNWFRNFWLSLRIQSRASIRSMSLFLFSPSFSVSHSLYLPLSFLILKYAHCSSYVNITMLNSFALLQMGLSVLVIYSLIFVSLSRNMNDICYVMDFFDNHDMWHFTSATALFLAFIGLLTVDDDIIFVNRKDIRVF